MQKLSFNSDWMCRALTGNDEAIPVQLPHDAMQYDSKSAHSVSGVNLGWIDARDYEYTKVFTAQQVHRDVEQAYTLLEFEGAYRNAEVMLNGKHIASHEYGYTGFYVDMSSALEEENTLTVRVHNSDQPNSRWYSGTGLYRPAWLVTLPEHHIIPDSLRITTVDYTTGRVSIDAATNALGEVRLSIADQAGNVVANQVVTVSRTESSDYVGAPHIPISLQNTPYEQRITTLYRLHTELIVPHAQLWDCDTPYLYTCAASFEQDSQQVQFGIRQIQLDEAQGLLINGERVILRGCCLHHDNGLLGARAYRSAEFRKVALMKQGGYNAIRSAHNPCSKAMLEACDQLGMLMLDEYVDGWYIHKTQYDYGTEVEQNYATDLADIVAKDYNHPSVIMYSIGNEVSETAQQRGIDLTDRMTQYLHSIDTTRPVTCGINIFFNFLSSLGLGVYTDEKAKKAAQDQHNKKAVGSEFFNKLAGLLGADFMKFGATLPPCDWKTRDAFGVLDVAGYNYGIRRYHHDLRKYPYRFILGSETFCSDAAQFWDIAQHNPRIIGDFVWAGMDYLGEVSIGSHEYGEYAKNFDGSLGWVSAGAGRFDLTGKPLAESLYTQVAFGQKAIAMAVTPLGLGVQHSPSAWKMSNAIASWSWEGQTGKTAHVEVYARADSVALELNGRRIGRHKVGKNARVAFNVPYEPGTLTVISFDSRGEEIAKTQLTSAGKETILHAIPERQMLHGTDDLAYVRFAYTDQDGIVKPLVRADISIEVEHGELLGFGSACPYYERSYLSNIADTYYGEALAIIQPDGDEPLIVCAQSRFGEAVTEIEVL